MCDTICSDASSSYAVSVWIGHCDINRTFYRLNMVYIHSCVEIKGTFKFTLN